MLIVYPIRKMLSVVLMCYRIVCFPQNVLQINVPPLTDTHALGSNLFTPMHVTIEGYVLKSAEKKCTLGDL